MWFLKKSLARKFKMKYLKAMFLEACYHLSASLSLFFDIFMPSDHIFLFLLDLVTSLHSFSSPHLTIIVWDLKWHRWTLQCPVLNSWMTSCPMINNSQETQSHSNTLGILVTWHASTTDDHLSSENFVSTPLIYHLHISQVYVL